ncbi:MAG TPA: hypothetical protein VFU40_03010 [Gemmatimonadales bacterium]|nr:hypothetical protein [Gemmatimonadales bacterium]
MSAIRTLLQGSIDYAGLFPPAGLDMATAVANYARYHTGPSAWALGRFITPAGRLPEFEIEVSRLPRSSHPRPWRLGVLAGPDLAHDLGQIDNFSRRHMEAGSPALVADTVELKAASEDGIRDALQRTPASLQAYIEVPIDRDPSTLVAAIGRAGGRAKVRTGGVSRDAFPSSGALLRFVASCIRAAVPFKATAGLHHPLRGDYRLTYAADSPCGTMFGFLNLFLAVAFLRAGMIEAEVAQLLEEGAAEAFQFDETGLSWRKHRLELPVLRDVRRDGIISFGSCSFTEPIDDLEALRLLEPRAQRA